MDTIIYVYCIIVFVFGLGASIWVMIFYCRQTYNVIIELQKNDEYRVAEQIKKVSENGKLPPWSSFSKEKILFLKAWKDFRKSDFSGKSEKLLNFQRTYRLLTYIRWISFAVFGIPLYFIIIEFIKHVVFQKASPF